MTPGPRGPCPDTACSLCCPLLPPAAIPRAQRRILQTGAPNCQLSENQCQGIHHPGRVALGHHRPGPREPWRSSAGPQLPPQGGQHYPSSPCPLCLGTLGSPCPQGPSRPLLEAWGRDLHIDHDPSSPSACLSEAHPGGPSGCPAARAWPALALQSWESSWVSWVRDSTRGHLLTLTACCSPTRAFESRQAGAMPEKSRQTHDARGPRPAGDPAGGSPRQAPAHQPPGHSRQNHGWSPRGCTQGQQPHVRELLAARKDPGKWQA